MADPVVHFEVIGKDPDALRRFYGEAFGWRFSAPIGPTDYTVVERSEGESGIGGGIGGVPEGYPGHVTFYVGVQDVGAALERVESLGATRMMGPDTVPGGPTIGLFNDPEGRVIGLVDIAAAM